MLDKILSISFWFDLTPGGWQSLRLFFGAVGLVLVVAGAVLKYYPNIKPDFKYRKTINRLGNGFIAAGVLELILWWWRDQQVPFFSARFWYALWAGGVVVWLVFVVGSFRRTKKRQEEQARYKEEFAKYLPKREK